MQAFTILLADARRGCLDARPTCQSGVGAWPAHGAGALQGPRMRIEERTAGRRMACALQLLMGKRARTVLQSAVLCQLGWQSLAGHGRRGGTPHCSHASAVKSR